MFQKGENATLLFELFFTQPPLHSLENKWTAERVNTRDIVYTGIDTVVNHSDFWV